MVRQYVTNPDCPECNGLAGTQRLVMKAISWGRYFAGDKPGRKQGYAYETFHCRRCMVEEPADA